MLNKVELEKKLDEIAQILEAKSMESSHLGVLAGISGISMFFFYYAKYRQDNKFAKIGNEILEESINRMSDGYSFPTYCSGIAGAGWVFEHLSEEGFIEIDNDQLLSELESYLYQKMMQDIAVGHYDFLHGAIGYGLYFLKRFKNTKSVKLKKNYESYIKELLEGLNEASEKDEHGLKWPSEMLALNESTIIYNLSLSHGISSIINFLSRAYKHQEFRSEVFPLLRGGISYLLAQERLTGISLFPNAVYKKSIAEPPKGRLAWCYGDLGIGISLYIAGQATQNPKLTENAIRILKHSASRKRASACSVVDASPCHGAFGVAQIYRTIFRETQIQDFDNAARHWLKEGLKFSVHGDGYAGFKQYRIGKPPTNETNLLEGIAGIGLVIISFLADFDTSWEESLLIN